MFFCGTPIFHVPLNKFLCRTCVHAPLKQRISVTHHAPWKYGGSLAQPSLFYQSPLLGVSSELARMLRLFIATAAYDAFSS
jgi:hypothetical protein